MKTILFSVFCIVFSLTATAQGIATEFSKKETLSVDSFIGVDEFKNLYYITDNIFYKRESANLFQFNDFSLGDLSSVDILNPLKIVLFYENTNTAVILDNTLSEIDRINFNQIADFRNVQYATTAVERNLWIYNLDLQQLELYDYNRNEITANTLPISDVVDLQKSNYNFCWLLTETEIQKYNVYGSLIIAYSFDDVKTFTEKNGTLVVATERGFSYLKKGEQEFQTLKIPKIDAKDLYLDIEKLYIYDGETLHHYQLKLPQN